MSESSGRNSRPRRQFTAEEKATILRRHLVDKVPVSDLCDEYQIQPTLFYLWQRQAFEHLSEALQDGRTSRGQSQTASADRARLAALEARLAKKDAIIAEVSEEYLALKKKLGGAEAAMGPTRRARRGRGFRPDLQRSDGALDALGAGTAVVVADAVPAGSCATVA